MSSFWDITSTYGPGLLAIMGLLVTLRPPNRDSHWIWTWIGGFAFVAFLTAWGTKVSQQELGAQISGGDGVPRFYVMVPNAVFPTPPPGTYNLLLAVDGKHPLFDVSFEVRVVPSPDLTPEQIVKAFHPIAAYQVQTAYVGATFTPITLGPGTYAIQGRTRRAMFVEDLVIPPSGPTKQTYELYNFSGGLVSCSPSPECRGNDSDPIPAWPLFAPGL